MNASTAVILGTIAAVFVLALSGCSGRTTEEWCAQAAGHEAQVPRCEKNPSRCIGGDIDVAYEAAYARAHCDWKREPVERVGERP